MGTTTITNGRFIGSQQSNGSSSTASVNYPTGANVPVARDLLVLVVSSGNAVSAPTHTTPSGWTSKNTLTDTTATRGARTTIYYKYRVAGDSETSVSVTLSASDSWVAQIHVYRFMGFPTTSADPFISNTILAEASVGDTTISPGAATNVEANVANNKSWVMAACMVITSSGTGITNSGSGWTSTQRQGAINSDIRQATFDSNGGVTDNASINCTFTSASTAGKVAWLGNLHACESVTAAYGGGATEFTDSKVLSRTSVGSDDTHLSDTPSKSRSKPQSDNANPSDTRVLTRGPQPSDLMAPTDAKTFSQTKAPSDPSGLIDTTAKTRSGLKTDDLSLTDVDGKSQQKSFAEAEPTFDARSITRQTQLSDDVDLDDPRSLSRTVIRTDDEAETDAFNRTRQPGASDSLTLSDDENQSRQKTVADPESLTDPRSFRASYTRQDTEPITEVPTKSKVHVRSDPEDLSDSRDLARGFEVDDPETLTDQDLVGPYSRLRLSGGGGGPSGRVFFLELCDGMSQTDQDVAGDSKSVIGADRVRLRDSIRIGPKRAFLDRLKLRDSALIYFKNRLAESDRLKLSDRAAIEHITFAPDRSGAKRRILVIG